MVSTHGQARPWLDYNKFFLFDLALGRALIDRTAAAFAECLVYHTGFMGSPRQAPIFVCYIKLCPSSRKPYDNEQRQRGTGACGGNSNVKATCKIRENTRLKCKCYKAQRELINYEEYFVFFFFTQPVAGFCAVLWPRA